MSLTLSVTPLALSLQAGETATVTASKSNPNDATSLRWVTMNPAIATVVALPSGNNSYPATVTAKLAGSTVINVLSSATGAKASVAVDVGGGSLAVTPTTLLLVAGGKAGTLQTAGGSSIDTITWAVRDQSVAKLSDPSDSSVTVNPIAEGETVVTAKSQTGTTVSATVKVSAASNNNTSVSISGATIMGITFGIIIVVVIIGVAVIYRRRKKNK